MALLKTLLGAFALCAALLIWADRAIGPEQSGLEPAAGLTAATVLASDGMEADGSPGDGRLDRAALDRLVHASSGKTQAAVASEKPAG